MQPIYVRQYFQQNAISKSSKILRQLLIYKSYFSYRIMTQIKKIGHIQIINQAKSFELVSLLNSNWSIYELIIIQHLYQFWYCNKLQLNCSLFILEMKKGKNAIFNSQDAVIQNNEGFSFNSTELIFSAGLLDILALHIPNQVKQNFQVWILYVLQIIELNETACIIIPVTICVDRIYAASKQLNIPYAYENIIYCISDEYIKENPQIRIKSLQQFYFIGSISILFHFQLQLKNVQIPLKYRIVHQMMKSINIQVSCLYFYLFIILIFLTHQKQSKYFRKLRKYQIANFKANATLYYSYSFHQIIRNQLIHHIRQLKILIQHHFISKLGKYIKIYFQYQVIVRMYD
ncbi:unnamed protein product [Paramecium pentaurelia]|uniref:Transmembrane protein n=1 Tax=Paramecium pentaurelia TaxID=43138 RepID=A0A8S1XWG4_9CILI|nr:unnamed protein product [Paramecium pentaurelia]